MAPFRSDRFLEKTLAAIQEVEDKVSRVPGPGEKSSPLQFFAPELKCAISVGLLLAALLARRMEVPLAVWMLTMAGGTLLLPEQQGYFWKTQVTFLGLSMLVAIPALFLTPSPSWTQLPLPWGTWAYSDLGLKSAILMLCRTQAAFSTMLLLTFSTTQWQLLRALRQLGVPALVVAILAMTTRYIHLLVNHARDLVQGRRSRVLAPLSPTARRQLAASCTGLVLQKSLHTSSAVHQAMLARGFRGDFPRLENKVWGPRDSVGALVGTVVVVTLVYWGQL